MFIDCSQGLYLQVEIALLCDSGNNNPEVQALTIKLSINLDSALSLGYCCFI